MSAFPCCPYCGISVPEAAMLVHLMCHPELCERWQELAWRVNKQFHKESTPVGEIFVAFLEAVKINRVAAEGAGGNRPLSSREVAIAEIAVPGTGGRTCRFPAKRNADMREMWRMLCTWLKSSNMEAEFSGLTKQQRWYAHNWSECWIGIQHFSTGLDTERALHLRKGRHVHRRQVREVADPNPADADFAFEGEEGTDGHEGEEQEASAAPPKRKGSKHNKLPPSASSQSSTRGRATSLCTNVHGGATERF